MSQASSSVRSVALATVIAYTAVGIRNIVRSARWKGRERRDFAARVTRAAATSATVTATSAYFYLLVPALREQRVIEDALRHLRSLDHPADRFEIIVAVDAEEEITAEHEHSTARVVQDYAKNNPDGAPISVVAYQGPEQRRSLQLNVALDRVHDLLEQRPRAERVIVGVYDADSRPEPETLAYIDDLLRTSPDAKAFQQTVTYLENHEELAGRGLVHANAVYQSLWNYSLEIPRLLASRDRVAAGRALPYPPYGMGHGEFFDLRVLDQVGGFPATGPCDGIQIGFALSRAGVAIHPVPFDDSCQSPTTPAALVRQHTFWYSGNLQFFRWYTPRSTGTLLPFLTQCVLAGKWLCRPVVFAIAVTGARRQFGWAGAVALGTYVYAYYRVGAEAVRRTSAPSAAAGVRAGGRGLLPLAAGFKSVGAINAIRLMLRGKSTLSKVER